MSNFSDKEDKKLVQLVKASIDAGKKIPDWDRISRALRSKTRYQLRSRLKTLKKRFGNDVLQFPCYFFYPLTTISSARRDVFCDIPKELVRQPSGQRDWNMGEILPAGVARMIRAVKFVEDDVFVDFGSGVGNVVTQVTMETKSRLCIGLEMRSAVVDSSSKLVAKKSIRYPLLRKVQLHECDFRLLDASDNRVHGATVAYALNIVYEGSSNFALKALVCDIGTLRCLVLSERVCRKHGPRCKREFCMIWREKEAILVPCSYSCKAKELIVYTRVAI